MNLVDLVTLPALLQLFCLALLVGVVKSWW
jgi:hypothetical protein